MADHKDEHVLIALFDNADFANCSVELLKNWDLETNDTKLGAIGVMTKKGNKVKIGVPYKTDGGAKIDTVLGIMGAVLTDDTNMLVGAMKGVTLGRTTGRFFKKSLQLTKEAIQALGTELGRGKAAVVVTCDRADVQPASRQLTYYGGDVKRYMVSQEALTEAVTALATQEGMTPTVETVANEVQLS